MNTFSLDNIFEQGVDEYQKKNQIVIHNDQICISEQQDDLIFETSNVNQKTFNYLLTMGYEEVPRLPIQKYVSDKIVVLLQPNYNPSVIAPQNISYVLNQLGLAGTYPYTDTSLSSIQNYYNKGYRIFIAIHPSANLVDILPFFQSNPDAYLVSPTTTTADPAVINRTNTNVYRISTDCTVFAPIYVDITNDLNVINPITQVNLVYQAGDNYSLSLYPQLVTLFTNAGYTVNNAPTCNPVSSRADIDSLVPIMTQNNNTVTCIIIVNQDLRDYIKQVVATQPNGYFIEHYPSLPNISSGLQNRIFGILYEPLFERNVQKQINALGIENSFLPMFDTVNIAERIASDGDNALAISQNPNTTLIGSQGYLYFNSVYDRIFSYYNRFSFDGTNWIITNQYFNIGGTDFKTNFFGPNTFRPSLLTPLPNYSVVGKKICFLLTDLSARDDDVKVNLQYLNYNYPIFNITTVVTPQAVKSLMENLTNQGYGVFIGLDTTTILELFNDNWFKDHPEQVAISLYSTGEDLKNRTNTNVYRMQTPAYISYNYYVDKMLSLVPPAATIFFVIEENDQASIQLYNGISALIPNSYTKTKIDVNNSTDMSVVFSTVNQPNTVTLVSITTTIPRQNFYDEFSGAILGQFIQGGSTTLPSFGPNVDSYYFLMFNPSFERNIQALKDNLGNETALPLLDSIQMAENFVQSGSFDSLVGSYGYTYFNEIGDRNFDIFAIWYWNSLEWSYDTIYNTVNQKVFKGGIV